MQTHTTIAVTRRALIAIGAYALLLLVLPQSGAAQDNDMGPLAQVRAEQAFGYLSGNYRTFHNHPAIFSDSGTGRLVVLGTGYRRDFPLAKAADAVKAYRNLLVDRGYEPDGKKKKKSRQEEYDELMGMLVATMSDSTKGLFTAEQLERFGDLAPSAGYDYFSGHTGGYPNHPVIYAHLHGFTIVGRGFKKDMPMKQASKAFAEYLALVKR
jgi:hypothetical protein